jgi:hypothetical protein
LDKLAFVQLVSALVINEVLSKFLHEIRAIQQMKAEIVLNVRAPQRLSANVACENKKFQLLPRKIHSRRKPRRPCADDDRVVHEEILSQKGNNAFVVLNVILNEAVAQ